MFKKTTLILICSLIIGSCTNRETDNEQPTVQDETPAVLNDTKTINKINSSVKRYDSDIIQKLYLEAIDNDSDLEKLVERFEEIEEIKVDSLKLFNKYIQNNSRYWKSVDYYINSLSDSTLKKEIKTIFEELKINYHERIVKHNSAKEILSTRAETLKDDEILMKLIITMPMMMNYQRNELPNIQTINILIDKYDTLINDTKKYIELKK